MPIKDRMPRGNAKWLLCISGLVLLTTFNTFGTHDIDTAVQPTLGQGVGDARGVDTREPVAGEREKVEVQKVVEEGSQGEPKVEAARGTGKKVLPYVDEVNELDGSCKGSKVSTGELGNFEFWGKTMNSSWPCPTSGMNNQMQMLMFYHNCKVAHEKPELLWRDITCSPTGGVHKDGGRYEVGSKSYTYTWFRWSSLFNVTQGGICYDDKHTWSMHQWLKGCGFTDAANKAFYATPSYWKQRHLFDFRQSYYTEVEKFLEERGLARKPFLAVHLRKGDYVKFCKEIKRSYKKLRLAHWKYAKGRGARDLYDKHMDTCSPSRDKVVQGINRLLKYHGLEDVVMATTHPEYRPGDAAFEADIHGRVHAFDASQYEMSKASFTAVDSIILARATHKLLNRYSTLSLTAVDLSVIKGWFNNETMWFW